ncbi:oligosaccharide flippase family protein [Vibrio owensii]
MKVANKNQFISDSLSLMFVKGLGLIVPLLVYPHLFRVFGAESLGTILFHFVVVEAIILLSSYGFEYSGVKRCSIRKNSLIKLSITLNNVIATRFLITFTLLIIVLCVSLNIKTLSFNYLIILVPYTVISSFYVQWFFLSIGKAKLSSIITLVTRAIYCLMVLFLVNQESKVEEVFYIVTVERLLLVLALYYFKKKRGLFFVRIKKRSVKVTMKRDFSLFLSRLLVIFYSKSNALIVGYIGSTAVVSALDFTSKIINVAKIPSASLSQIVYPHVSKTKSRRVFLLCFVLITTFSLLICFLLYLALPKLVFYLTNNELEKYINIMSLLLISYPISAVSSYVGASGLLSFNKKRYFNFSVYSSIVTYFFIMFIGFYLGFLSPLYIVGTYLFTEFLILMLRLIFVFLVKE